MQDKKKSATVKLLVLDVLKPHKPNIVEFGQALSEANGIDNMDITVYTVDEKTESVKIICEGSNLDFEVIKKHIEEFGAVIHSVDKICIGKTLCVYHLPDAVHKTI